LINTITHASKVFRILNTVLKDILVVERFRFELVTLVELIDTRNEELVDDLAASVEQIILSD
jgi:hypothetical protein